MSLASALASSFASSFFPCPDPIATGYICGDDCSGGHITTYNKSPLDSDIFPPLWEKAQKEKKCLYWIMSAVGDTRNGYEIICRASSSGETDLLNIWYIIPPNLELEQSSSKFQTLLARRQGSKVRAELLQGYQKCELY